MLVAPSELTDASSLATAGAGRVEEAWELSAVVLGEVVEGCASLVRP